MKPRARVHADIAARDRQLSGRIIRLKRMAEKLVTELERIDHQNSSETRDSLDFYEEVRCFEINLIIEALTQSRGHQLRAASLLNINPTTLNAKIKQYHIALNDFSDTREVENQLANKPNLHILS